MHVTSQRKFYSSHKHVQIMVLTNTYIMYDLARKVNHSIETLPTHHSCLNLVNWHGVYMAKNKKSLRLWKCTSWLLQLHLCLQPMYSTNTSMTSDMKSRHGTLWVTDDVLEGLKVNLPGNPLFQVPLNQTKTLKQTHHLSTIQIDIFKITSFIMWIMWICSSNVD